MEIDFTEEQRALGDVLSNIMAKSAKDADLLQTLGREGFLDAYADAGIAEAILVVEHAAAAMVDSPITTRALVAPLAGIEGLPDTVGLADRSTGAIVRFAPTCEAFLFLDGDEVFLATADEVEVEPMDSAFGWPLGRVTRRGGTTLAPGTAGALRRAWQTSIGLEAASLAHAALSKTAEHVRVREQFGKPIGGFQAVQHQLAKTFAMAEGARWLARRACWFVDDEFVTASAAAHGCATARSTYVSTQQVTGAVGLSSEYGLTDMTLRLMGLRQELGGQSAHARNVYLARRAQDPSGVPSPAPLT